MSKRGAKEGLSDILEAIERVKRYTKDMSYQSFLGDQKTQDAVVHNIEVIGEAVKNLDAGYKKKHPDVPWQKMAAARDKLIHHYFGVNYEVVWAIIKQDLPAVAEDIEDLFEDFLELSEKAKKDIAKAREDAAEGRVYSHEEVKKKHGM